MAKGISIFSLYPVQASEKQQIAAQGTFSNDLKNAILEEQSEKIGAILSTLSDADLRAKDLSFQGYTVMHWAVTKNDTQVIEQLKEKDKALINIPNEAGVTPLMLATTSNKKTIIECLIANGANLVATDKTGWTVMHHAVKNYKKEKIPFLHAKNQTLKDIPDSQGMTPLMEAARSQDVEAISELIAVDADLLAKDKNGWTVMHYAVDIDDGAVVEALHASSPSLKDIPDFDGMTPLAMAEKKGKTKTGAALIKVNARGSYEQFSQRVSQEKDFQGVILGFLKGKERRKIEDLLENPATKLLANHLKVEWLTKTYPTKPLQRLYLLNTEASKEEALENSLHDLRKTVLTTGGTWGLNTKRKAEGKELHMLVEIARKIGQREKTLSGALSSLAEGLILGGSPEIIRHQTIAYTIAANEIASSLAKVIDDVVECANKRLSSLGSTATITTLDMDQTLGRIYKRIGPKPITDRDEE